MTEVSLTRVDKPHSFEFGKSSLRHKIYYNDVAELMLHISKLQNVGLYPKDFI